MKHHLFYETSHSPSLVDLIGYEEAKQITDFCFISNPYYPTAAMIRELKDQLPSLIASYPSSSPKRSQGYLANVLEVPPENLVIGNGATELITLVSENLVESIGIPIPTFSEYLETIKNKNLTKLYQLPLQNNLQLNLEAFSQWLITQKVSSALIINPGNPTGQLHPLVEMKKFLESVRSLELVIVDESFIDFAGDPVPSLLPEADNFPNLLIVRSMSKHCGIPGLRLGYAYSGNKVLLDRLRAVIPIWNVNSIAEYFLSLLQRTTNEYRSARMRVIGDIIWLSAQLEKLEGLRTYRSGANFVLTRILGEMDSSSLQNELLQKHKMYVRDCSNKVGMDNKHIRIASQGPEKDQALVKALEGLVG